METPNKVSKVTELEVVKIEDSADGSKAVIQPILSGAYTIVLTAQQ